MLTKDKIDKHALQAVDCPPATWVVLRSAMHRLVDKESAATAPLLARIAELEKWQAEHWNALEIINNYFVSKDLLLVVEDGGPDAAARNIVHSVAALEQQLEEARKDAEMYRWLRDYHIGDDPESINLKKAKTKGLDAAIRAAIKEQTK